LVPLAIVKNEDLFKKNQFVYRKSERKPFNILDSRKEKIKFQEFILPKIQNGKTMLGNLKKYLSFIAKVKLTTLNINSRRRKISRY